jgi:hypothetical protein
MSFFTYFDNIPFATNNPSSDQPNMLTNTNSTDQLIAIDHHSFNDNLGGYHKVIHQTPFSTGADPASIPGIGQEYVKTVGSPSDQQLFYESGLGVISQLTGSNSALTPTGFAFSGGILFQWGFVLGTHGAAPKKFNGGDFSSITFPIPFPNNVFFISGTPCFDTANVPSSTSGFANVIFNSSTISNTAATWVFITNSGSYVKFFWLAVGN